MDRARTATASVAALAATALLASCAGAGSVAGTGDNGKTTITFATVNNPQMKDLEELAGEFEREHPKINVHFLQMEENDLRDSVTKDVATQSGQYDAVTISNYEIPFWADNGWLTNLSSRVHASRGYDYDDLLPPVRKTVEQDGKVLATPFYGESSFLMYRKDLFAKAGLHMPKHPTWKQVRAFAKKLDSSGRAGICLRGKPGWGEVFAPLTSTVNTFGGQWYDKDWNAKVHGEGFKKATSFYTNLVRDYGQRDPVSSGFTECLNQFGQGRAAMWYDATSAAGTLEDGKASKVAGKVGYVHAPVEHTKESGWLYSWNLAVPNTSNHKDEAFTFIRWATSKKYQKLVGRKLGWARVPPGTRASLYRRPKYRKEASAFADITRDVMGSVRPNRPGTKPQPYTGIQFVPIPEFQELGNRLGQNVADVIAGRTSVEAALESGQRRAQEAAKFQRREEN